LFLQRNKNYKFLPINLKTISLRPEYKYHTQKKDMTKADLVREVSKGTGIDRITVENTIEAFMESVKGSLAKNENVYLRGFGSFIVKQRAQKTARNITKNTTLIIPAHNVPVFKPAKPFVAKVKCAVK
jgi:DNA-binding protein HU-beta